MARRKLAPTVSLRALGRLLDHIVTAPVPARVDKDYLRSNGFTGHGDPALVWMLRLLGLVEPDGTPTETWVGYKADPATQLSRAVHEAYRPVFRRFGPEPWKRSDAELVEWFSPPRITTAATAQARAIRIFRFLCRRSRLAPHPTPPQRTRRRPRPATATTRAKHKTATPATRPGRTAPRSGPAQIVIAIPPASTQEDYEHFFRALRTVFWDE